MTLQDLRHAIRIHRRRPLVAAAILVTLGLGIGVNTAIFSIVNAVLLRPLPYPDSRELVRVYQTHDSLRASPNPRLQAIWNRVPVSWLNVLDWREESSTLEAIGLYLAAPVTFAGPAEPLRVEASRVDAPLFDVLGVGPQLGRGLVAADIEERRDVVVLSHRFWKEALAGDPDVLDRQLLLDDRAHAIVGVMPAGFELVGRPDDRLWLPLHPSTRDLEMRDNQMYGALARLRSGGSLEQASGELDRIAVDMARAHPDTNGGTGIRLAPVLETIVGPSRPLLALLSVAVGLVLLVAAVNVAHLLLAQASTRRRELAIRRALGASRARLVGQLMAESLLLAAVGGLAGLTLAMVARDRLLAWIPAELPRTAHVPIDLRVLGFALGISLLTAVTCGLLPAWLSAGRSAADDLKIGGTPQAGGRHRTHGLLVVAEVAVTLMLTFGAGLLIHSFVRLTAVDAGFDARGVLVQEVRLPASRYGSDHERLAFAEGLVAELAATPGVEHVALTTKLPFAGPALVAGFRIPGIDETTPEDWTRGRSASLKYVTPDYFETLGIRLVAGRRLEPTDRPDRGRVLVVNETFARTHSSDADPVGREILMGSDPTPYTIVGVVEQVRHDGLAAKPGPLMYQPWSQSPPSEMTVVVRTSAEPRKLTAPLRETLRRLDPALPLPQATMLSDLLDDSLQSPRARTTLVGLLAGLALLLALVGTYAVMAFGVQRRVREIGVRMALGADPGDVRRLVLRRAAALGTGGIALGVVGALAGARLLEGLLFEVDGRDPASLVIASVLLVVVCLAAGYLPARRASRVDPVLALRAE